MPPAAALIRPPMPTAATWPPPAAHDLQQAGRPTGRQAGKGGNCLNGTHQNSRHRRGEGPGLVAASRCICFAKLSTLFLLRKRCRIGQGKGGGVAVTADVYGTPGPDGGEGGGEIDRPLLHAGVWDTQTPTQAGRQAGIPAPSPKHGSRAPRGCRGCPLCRRRPRGGPRAQSCVVPRSTAPAGAAVGHGARPPEPLGSAAQTPWPGQRPPARRPRRRRRPASSRPPAAPPRPTAGAAAQTCSDGVRQPPRPAGHRTPPPGTEPAPAPPRPRAASPPPALAPPAGWAAGWER